jgi:hypothetical protein
MRLLSRLTLGDAGTIIASSASTNTGSYDAVTALTISTATLVISGSTTTATIGGGATIYGDISSVVNSAGGQLAIYVRKD